MSKEIYNGFLCEPMDTSSLYIALKKMINTNFKIRLKMSQNSRNLVLKNFDTSVAMGFISFTVSIKKGFGFVGIRYEFEYFSFLFILKD